MSRTSAVGVLAAGLVAVGCEDGPAIVVEGRRVAVAPYFDAPICAGTVAELDARVERVERESGLRGPELTTFFWGPGALRETCSGTAFSCAVPETAEIRGYLASLSHEIAHVVGSDAGATEMVVEEGFAILHGDMCASNGGVAHLQGLDEFLGLDADEIHQSGGAGTAGHFAIYISRNYGPELWSDFKALSPPGVTPEALAAAFAEVYDTPLEDAERRWYTEAPQMVCPPARDPVTMWTGEPITFTHDLDCNDVGTLGPFDRTLAVFPSFNDSDIVEAMYVSHRVVVPFLDVWRIDLDGPPGARVVFYSLDCTDYGAEDLPLEREVRVGEVVDLPMDACNQLIVILAPPDAPARVELRISRPKAGG